MGSDSRLPRVQLRHVLHEKPHWVGYLVLAIAGIAGIGVLTANFGIAPAVMTALFLLVAWFNVAHSRHAKPRPVAPGFTEVERDATLGADGLALRDRFVARDDIAKLEVDDRHCVITTRAGERIELRGTPLELARASHWNEISDLPRDEAGELILTRVDVAQLRVAPDAYRGLSLDDARCLSIAEDPRADTRARVAAASILQDRLDEAARDRIELAAEETAHSEVREALQASARRQVR